MCADRGSASLAPQLTLPPQVVAVWRWHAVLGCAGSWLALVLAGWWWPSWNPVLWLVGVAALILTAADLGWLIRRRHTAYRYALDAHGLRLRHGVFSSTRLMVPANQILYLEMQQGPLQRAFKLSTLRVGTVGSVHEVGPLDAAEAAALAATHLNRTPVDAPR